MEAIQNSIIDTVTVIHRCNDGFDCKNHLHGIIDTSYIYHYEGGKSYLKLPSIVENGVIYRNVYQNEYGQILYTDFDASNNWKPKEEVKQPLNAFDTIKVGTKEFPSATPFVASYSEKRPDYTPFADTDMMCHYGSFPVLVMITVAILFDWTVNKSWQNLFKEIVSV
jgi:hypothetical protein